MFAKKLLAAGFGAFSGLMLAAGSAHAVNLADTIFIGELNQWSDNSGEGIGVDASVNGSPAGVLDVGDTLRGTFDIQTIEDLSGGGGSTQYGTGGVNELSGIFEIEVASISVTSDPNNSCGGVASCAGGTLDGDETANYTFTSNAAFQAEFGLSGTTMVVFFEDSVPDYDRTGTVANAEATATDGTQVVEIGFSGDVDEFWVATGVPTDTTLAASVPAGTGLGGFNFALGFLSNSLFGGWLQVTTGCPILPATCPGDALVDIRGQGGILGTQGASTDYDVFNNVDLVFQPIPEPGTLGMLGIGLLGLGLFLRTRQQKAA
jgi:hypothetical protein